MSLGLFEPGLERPPPELARIPGLQRFEWLSQDGTGVAAAAAAGAAPAAMGPAAMGAAAASAPPEAALPGGPWLGSMQRLAATAQLLERSLGQLAAAVRLEQLCVTQAQVAPAAAAAVLRWAAERPSVQRVVLESMAAPQDGELAAAFLQVKGHRPELSITCCHPAPSVLGD